MALNRNQRTPKLRDTSYCEQQTLDYLDDKNFENG